MKPSNEQNISWKIKLLNLVMAYDFENLPTRVRTSKVSTVSAIVSGWTDWELVFYMNFLTGLFLSADRPAVAPNDIWHGQAEDLLHAKTGERGAFKGQNNVVEDEKSATAWLACLANMLTAARFAIRL